MIVSDFSIRHPAIITILMAALVVFAVLAATTLNREMIPPVALPMAAIITAYPGAGPGEVERDVSKPIENEMSTLPGVSTLRSTSSDSYSVVMLEFHDGVDVYGKLPQIRELLNGIADDLPEGIEGAPVVLVMESSSHLPMFSARVHGTMDAETLTTYLEENLVPAIARIPGVSKINLVGGARREARVTLGLSELESRGISALSVFQALQYGNVDMPAGSARYRSRELSLTTAGSFSDLEELGGLAVGRGADSPVFLRDVADIRITTAPPDVRVRSGGRDYVMVDVLKRDEGDTIRITAEAIAALDEIAAASGGAIGYAVISNQSETTQRSLATVLRSAWSGIVLTVLVIILVLHDARATVIIGLSIPLSALFALVGLYLTGKSLNLLTLSGMVVSIGMVVDNSIVVLENTHNHFTRSGDRRLAASVGAGEVGGAVVASTTTTVCVFAPLLFIAGIVGIILNDLSLAIVFSVGASLLVSVVVVPWLSSLILKHGDELHRPRAVTAVNGWLDRRFASLERAYRRILRWALDAKPFVIVLAAALLVASVLLLSVLRLSFLPPTDTGEFELNIATPAGTTLEETCAKVDEIDALVKSLVPEIQTDAYYVGSTSALALGSTPNRAYGRVRLVPSEDRARTIQQIIPVVQDAIARGVTDCDVTVLNGGFDALLALGTGGQGFQMEVYGADLDDVVATATMAREMLASDRDVFKTELSVSLDAEQLSASLSRAYLGTLGVTSYEAGVTSRILFGGMAAGTLRMGDRDYPIRVTSDVAAAPLSEDVLNRITLKTQTGRTVSFAAFSTLESLPTVSRIERKDRNFSIEVRGYLRTDDQTGVTARMQQRMAALQVPAGVKFRTAGTSKLITDSLRSLGLALAIALFLVYSVMVIQFERFLQPLVIMASVPFCLIGVVLGLYAFGSSLSIVGMLAFITLGGTVVNNAIVLVDYTNLLRRDRGMDLRAALLEGSANRLRPILMTTTTTLFGVLPMAFARGNGSEVYAPLGQSVMGGLLTSTLVTLIIVPLLYEVLEKRRRRVPPDAAGGGGGNHA